MSRFRIMAIVGVVIGVLLAVVIVLAARLPDGLPLTIYPQDEIICEGHIDEECALSAAGKIGQPLAWIAEVVTPVEPYLLAVIGERAILEFKSDDVVASLETMTIEVPSGATLDELYSPRTGSVAVLAPDQLPEGPALLSVWNIGKVRYSLGVVPVYGPFDIESFGALWRSIEYVDPPHP